MYRPLLKIGTRLSITSQTPRKSIYELNANKQVQRLELPSKAAQNDRLETTDEKIVALSDQPRQLVCEKGHRRQQTTNVNLQPKAKIVGAFGATEFVAETMSTETVISSSDIKAVTTWAMNFSPKPRTSLTKLDFTRTYIKSKEHQTLCTSLILLRLH